ncbi:hypothetical protein CLV84_0143 [Neolewinella xylanilytica]|uniref:Uncharacterized protein n=1 Tax=Neolewinella xylanilytica TaxID=1514080 RepID=A0A2S6I6V6_9BACT|nr:hypothetical protein [Neolewinella xylanilytica]PPK87207.1 hypothetical protein CLV84_0143 [Neolewinella xylanilytica]
MQINRLGAWLGRAALVALFLVCLAVIIVGIWLANFSLLGKEPPQINVICQFTAPDGLEYTVYQTDGGTTVGSSVGVYRGRAFEPRPFHWWAYAAGDRYRAGLTGDQAIILVDNKFSNYAVTDTLVFDLSKESDYVLEASQLTQPILPLCSESME